MTTTTPDRALRVRYLPGAAHAFVDAPAHEVFAAITDLEQLPAWNTHVRRVLEPASRPLGPGVEWVVLMAAMGTTWPSRSRIGLHDPDALRFEYTSRSDDGNPGWTGWRWRVTPLPGDQSRVDVAWDHNPRTFLRQVLAARVRCAQLAEEVPASLAALGSVLRPRPTS